MDACQSAGSLMTDLDARPAEPAPFAPEARGAAAKDGLALSLQDLSGLQAAHGAVAQTLERIAHLALRAVPAADGAGLSLLETDRPMTLVATDELVQKVNRMQHMLHEGPSLSAVSSAGPVISGNLGGAAQWPRFGPRAGRLGLHSALSLPLVLNSDLVGALTFYAHAKDGFDVRAAAVGEAFAGPAAVSVSNAQRLAQSERLVEQLQQALTSRAQIDQAVGLLMGRTGADAPAAFERLRRMSQARSVKVAALAAELLEEAVGTARARRPSGPAAAGGPSQPESAR